MAFWTKQPAQPPDRLNPEALAQFGRFKFLGPGPGAPFDEFAMVQPVLSDVYPSGTPAYEAVVAEVTRHAAKGEWERVGGWKFAREYLSGGPGVNELIDAGLLAIHRMRVTNLAGHLAPIDSPRYVELTGGPIPNDGFFGPPIFDSDYGPTRQYYFDHAIASAARRQVTRVESASGVVPGPIDVAARSMWDLGMLVYRGPLLVSAESASEQGVVRAALGVARGVDHALFVERLTEAVLDPDGFLGPFGAIGAARFVEDYLDPAAVETAAYGRLLDHALTSLLTDGMLGRVVAAELLTFRQRARLAALETPEP